MRAVFPRSACAAALFACLVCPAPAGADSGPDGGPRLRLNVGTFDPTIAAPDLPAHLRLDSEPASGVFVIQFDEAITPGLLSRVAAAGARPLAYLPDRAYLVRLPEGVVPSVRALPGVRWLGPVQPGWKIAPHLGTRPFSDPSRRTGDTLVAHVHLFPGEDPEPVATAARAAGSEPIQTFRFGSRARLKVRGTRAQLEQLATEQAVSWIEEVGELIPRNNTTRWVIQTDVPGVTSVWDRGLHGEGQIVGHIDSRLDMNSCYFNDPVDNTPGPGHRKVIAYRSSSGLGASSHGTHTAGTVAGDQLPVNGTLDNNGNAWAAKISHTNSSDISGFGSSPSNLYDALRDAHLDGARVHTNSWGDDGLTSYTTWCVDIDAFSYDFEDSLVLFAVTNTSTLRTPENAKNVLAVGASQNGTADDQFCSGGTGPTSDGRRKPEIYAPGCSIQSARSASACAIRSLTGTSMACPAVTAAGALVRQYFEEGHYPTGAPRPEDATTPSGALVKATLLNSAVDMTGLAGYPGNREGWGRVLLENALYFDGDVRVLSLLDDVRNANGLSTGQSTSYVLTVDGSQESLKITLAYTEPPAVLLASSATVNDLNLEVVSPSGQTYLGNVIDPAGGVSVPGGTPDALNNVEMVLLENPEIGDWAVTVRGAAVNQGTQGYALVATGQVLPFTPVALRHLGHVVLDGAPGGNGDGVVDPGETVTLPVTLRNLGATDATAVSGALASDHGDVVKITEAVAAWPDIAGGGSGTSLAPHYRFTVSPDAACGTRVSFEVATMSSLEDGTTGFSVDVGQTRLVAPAQDVPLTIPKKTSAPVTSAIDVADAFTVADVQVAVTVQHGDIGQLTVDLSSPSGTTVRLHDATAAGTVDLDAVYDSERQPDGPGTLADFDGQPAQGAWTLTVRDAEAGPVPPGQVVAWSLDLRAVSPIRCNPLVCAEPVPGEVGPSLVLGIDDVSDLRFEWSPLAGAAGYRVWTAAATGFADEILVGSSTATTLVEPGGASGEGLAFYVVRAVNACEWEGP